MGNEKKQLNKNDYERYMLVYIKTAQVIMQVCVAALILPIIFIRDILGIEENVPIFKYLKPFYTYWVLLCLTIGTSLLYQTCAAMRIEFNYEDKPQKCKLQV